MPLSVVDELKKVYSCQKDNEPIPSMFEDKDLVAMFGMFDVTGCGKISHQQVSQAMRNLGIEDYAPPSTDKVAIHSLLPPLGTCHLIPYSP